jgi:hypothetical protein
MVSRDVISIGVNISVATNHRYENLISSRSVVSPDILFYHCTELLVEIRLNFTNKERVICLLYVVIVNGYSRSTTTEYYRGCPDHRILHRNRIYLETG